MKKDPASTETDDPVVADETADAGGGATGIAKPSRSVPPDGDEPAAKAVAAGGEAPAHPHVTPRKSLRTIYYALWFVLVPFALAWVLVWALAPPSGVDRPGILGIVEGWVREQPVPFGIVTFTLFEMAFWAARHHLPFAYHAHPPLRQGLPKGMRQPFERARALLEEADVLLERHRDAITKELSAKEREKLRADLASLEEAMEREPFDEESFVDALVRADGEVDIRLGRWRKSEVREYAESILVAVAVAMSLRAFVVEAFKIPSGSMIPTLQVGDHIFVNKFTYGPAIPYTQTRLWSHMPPERGDVIVFAYPEHPEQDFIKRVIAIPGDKLEARNGHPILNGWQVPSCYVGPYAYVEPPDGGRHEGDVYVEFLEDEAFLTFFDKLSGQGDYQGPFLVKPNEVYVMGDNRNNSHDSRMWWQGQGGGVPFQNIKGRALFVWLSVGERWDFSRILAPVMGRPPGHGPFGTLPPSMKALEGAVETCLKNRPPLAQTRPPKGEAIK